MRYLVLVLSLLFLASCSTPQTAPQSFYAGVYVPGKVEFKEQGAFISSAGVFSKKDLPTAEKAAYARLMLEAKKLGYRYFQVTEEKTTAGLGRTFRLYGVALKSPQYNGRTYTLSSIKNLLRGGSLVAIKRPPSKKPVVSNRRPLPRPDVTAAGSAEVEEITGEPTVIMAPEDITGSIQTAKRRSDPITVSTATALSIELPAAVSGLPQGVRMRRK